MKCLTDFRNLLNIDHNMTAEQISYCAESIVGSNEFYMLRLEDFDLCFRMALNGELGTIYNRMDQPCIFKFLREYSLKRDNELARKRETESDRNNIHEIFQNDTMHTILTDVVSKLSIKEEKKPEPLRVVTPEQEVVNSWITDFDRLYEQSGNDTGTVRMVHNESGDLIGLSQYLDNRLKEYNENK